MYGTLVVVKNGEVLKMAASAEAAEDVQMTETVAVLPPRPDAIITMLTTDDFLPGAQTLLYSVKVDFLIFVLVCMVLRSSHSCFSAVWYRKHCLLHYRIYRN